MHDIIAHIGPLWVWVWHPQSIKSVTGGAASLCLGLCPGWTGQTVQPFTYRKCIHPSTTSALHCTSARWINDRNRGKWGNNAEYNGWRLACVMKQPWPAFFSAPSVICGSICVSSTTELYTHRHTHTEIIWKGMCLVWTAVTDLQA